MDRYRMTFDWRLLKAQLPWFLLVLFLSALFFFCCSITVATFPGWPAALLIKKYGVMTGLVLILACLVPQLFRGKFFETVPLKKLASYSAIIFVALCTLLLGLPHLSSFGHDFATMSSDYWTADYTDMRTVLLKRVAMSALAHLLGFRKATYILFWFAVFLVALTLAIRFLIVRGLTFLECLSILTASLFAYELVVPGYNEVLILLLALFCMQRATSFLDKWVILLLAMATHEVAATIIFVSVLLSCSEKDRNEWFLVFPFMIALVLATSLTISFLQKGGRPGETLTILGTSPLHWALKDPVRVVIAILVSYKLYWIIPIFAWKQPSLRLATLALPASIPLIFIAVDGSRLVQFTSLTLFFLAPLVLSSWTPKTRSILAIANLIIPTFVVETWRVPIWGRGIYSGYLLLSHSMGFAAGSICHF